MEHVASLENAKNKLRNDISAIVSDTKAIISDENDDLNMGLDLLERLRKAIYEDLNQVLHEALLVRGIEYLNGRNDLQHPIDWYWNPRQTGTGDEPDLQGRFNNEVVVSAEASTSAKPQGVIDSRMRDTLTKLSRMNGILFYFVTTQKMMARAETKVRRLGFQITVINCGIPLGE